VRRRRIASRKPAKALPTIKAKRGDAPTAARRRGSTAANLQMQLDQRTRELAEAQKHLAEALNQQTATAEVLHVISSSAGELELIFQAILANAMRLCEAKFGFIYRYDDETWEMMAGHGAVPEYVEAAKDLSVRPGPETMLGRISRTKQMAQVHDVVATRGYTERDPLVVLAVETGGVRTHSAAQIPHPQGPDPGRNFPRLRSARWRSTKKTPSGGE
jgi:hypothetical protein